MKRARMRRARTMVHILLLSVAVAAVTGCATIFSGRNATIRMEGIPEGTELSVVNQNNEVVYEGAVPEQLKLRRMVAIREAARYRMRFDHPDYYPRDVIIDPSNNWPAEMSNWLLALILVIPAPPAAIVPMATDFFAQSTVELEPRRISNLEMVPRVPQAETAEVSP